MRALAEELFTIDVRFGELGEPGIFEAMDRAGSLDHQVPGVEDIDAAMTEPPALGRARLRGECVKRLSGNGARYICSWDRIVDRKDRTVLDLADPWRTSEQWGRRGEACAAAAGLRARPFRRMRFADRRPAPGSDSNGADNHEA